MASPLLRLPQELLIRVASYLTTPELGKLRGTCKDVESNLFESFAHEFFHKRQFMLEEPSLQALVDISRHPTLSKRLTEVIISKDCYVDSNDPTSIIGQKLLLGGYASRDNLISSGQAKDMLVEAFDNLPNLSRVGLRDYNAKGRYRDGDDAKWRSYGWSLVDGMVWRPASSAYPFVVLLAALGSSSAHVVNFEVFLRHRPGLSDMAFDVLSERSQSSVGRAVSRLKVLMLSLDTEAVIVGNPAAIGLSNTRIKKFLHQTRELEHLRLNFNERDKRAPELLEWLALSPTASTVNSVFDCHSTTAPLRHLTTLDIGMVSVRPETLIKILARFELHSCNLWKVNLATGRDIDLTLDPTTNPAQKFFNKLAEAMKSSTSLRRAKIGFMTIDGVRADRINRTYPVDFPRSRDDYKKVGDDKQQHYSKPICREVNFGGGAAATFAEWAKELAGRAICLRIKGPVKGPPHDFYVDASDQQDDPDTDEPYSDEEIDDDEEDEEDDD